MALRAQKSALSRLSKLSESCSKMHLLSNLNKRWLHVTSTCRTTNDNVVKSPDHIDAVTGVTVPEFLWSNLHKWADAPAFECGVSGRRYTHGQIHKLSRNFAKALMQHGLQRPDVVGILLPNLPEYPVAMLGSWEANLAVTTINPTYKPEEIAKQINDCQAKLIITISQFAPLAQAIQKLSPSLKSIVVIGEPVDGCHSFTDMVKVDSTGAEFAKGSKFDTTQEVAYLPYSSGTTGPPKGVMLTHSSICSNIVQFCYPGYLVGTAFENGAPQPRSLGLLPFFHVYGSIVIMTGGLYLGGFIRTLPNFQPNTFIQAIREHKPTRLHLVPPLMSFLANSPDITKKEFETINVITGGAAPIGETLVAKLREKAGKYFFFQEGYGMTELSAVSNQLTDRITNKKTGSCGVLLPGTGAKLVDPSTGDSVGVNQRGELWIRGPQVMKGYLGREEATAETIDKDGWLHTGDVAVYDQDLCFYIVDRIKELIKVKGLQVAPSELEDILRTHPGVKDVAVIGVPDERAGELPRAYIVRESDALTETEVADFLAKKVSDHKKLKGGVEFLSVIPRATSGKILRRELKTGFLSKIK